MQMIQCSLNDPSTFSLEPGKLITHLLGFPFPRQEDGLQLTWRQHWLSEMTLASAVDLFNSFFAPAKFPLASWWCHWRTCIENNWKKSSKHWMIRDSSENVVAQYSKYGEKQKITNVQSVHHNLVVVMCCFTSVVLLYNIEFTSSLHVTSDHWDLSVLVRHHYNSDVCIAGIWSLTSATSGLLPLYVCL